MTAVNAGQTATACAGITDYLDLVKAQTGKKLTPAQANQLTTDATDLADALAADNPHREGQDRPNQGPPASDAAAEMA